MNIFYLKLRLIRLFNLLFVWLRQKLLHVCPPLWYFSDLDKHFNITVRIGPLRLSHIFLLYLLSVVSSIWPVFGFIFSARYLHRNLCIWWCVRTTSNEVIFMPKFSPCQVAIYWVLRGQLFLSLITSQKHFFSKVRLVSETSRSDISRESIKI